MHDSVHVTTPEIEDTPENEDIDRNSRSSSKEPPRVDPKNSHDHQFWKSPFTEDQNNALSKPSVIHIIEDKENVISRLHHLRENLYIPLTKCSVFYSHWLQNLMDTELKFYLHPMPGHNAISTTHYEGVVLLNKLRYILAKFEWNSLDPIRLQLTMAENHGNRKFRKKRKLRPLFSHTVYVDHSTSSVLFKGI